MRKISANSFKALIYGGYAVICHLCGILLFFNIERTVLPQELIVRRCAQMLEYSLMSIAILLVGGMLFQLVNVNNTEEG